MSAITTARGRTGAAQQPGVEEVPSRHLEVVEVPVRRHTLLYALAILVVLGGAVFGAVTLNALAAADAVEARNLDVAVAEGERRYAQLVADVAALEDPARIREAALELGLVPGEGGRHLQLTRALPADGAVTELAGRGQAADPLKPVLSLER